MSGFDNNLQTSWFSAHGDCATQAGCTHVPTYQIDFATPQLVGRISMRGNREYATGYDFIAGRFELLGASGTVSGRPTDCCRTRTGISTSWSRPRSPG